MNVKRLIAELKKWPDKCEVLFTEGFGCETGPFKAVSVFICSGKRMPRVLVTLKKRRIKKVSGVATR